MLNIIFVLIFKIVIKIITHRIILFLIIYIYIVFLFQETDEDQDSLKETMMETNIYLLGLTIAISILHSVFELLSFKNDIQFWNNRQSLEGLSVRSVFFGVFQSLIVLLYVLDNATNFMIRVSCFIGLGIEVWKIHKVVDINYNTVKLYRWVYNFFCLKEVSQIILFSFLFY